MLSTKFFEDSSEIIRSRLGLIKGELNQKVHLKDNDFDQDCDLSTGFGSRESMNSNKVLSGYNTNTNQYPTNDEIMNIVNQSKTKRGDRKGITIYYLINKLLLL